jgi:hypothetical protein
MVRETIVYVSFAQHVKLLWQHYTETFRLNIKLFTDVIYECSQKLLAFETARPFHQCWWVRLERSIRKVLRSDVLGLYSQILD